MKTVHCMLQVKGGVGKSLISAVLAQYLINNNSDTHLFDTDPLNQTFSRYKALNVEVVNIVGANNVIDHSKFDMLIEELINRNGIALIDNGSATFLPLMQYFKENAVLEMLQQYGVEVVFHIPLQGGGGLEDTLDGLAAILENFNVKVVVWLNHNQGDIVISGKQFVDTKIYKDNADKIIGVCEIKNRQNNLYDSDIQRMTENHLTLDEIKQSTDPLWRLMNKQRISIFYRDICEQLDAIPLFTAPAAKQGKEKADKVEKSTATA